MVFSIRSGLVVKSCSLSTESLKPTTAASPVDPITVCVKTIPVLVIAGRRRAMRELVSIRITMEVGDLLGDTVIGDPEIRGFQVVNHIAAGVAHGHGSVHERDLHFNFGLRVLRRLLYRGAGFWRKWPGGGLGGWSASQSHLKRQS